MIPTSRMSSWDPGAIDRSTSKLNLILRFIRIEHTFLSLPMAYTGSFLAINSVPSLRVLLLIFTALFFIRVSGMTIDNIVDLEVDAINPRTKNRPLVTGALSIRDAWLLFFIGLTSFFVSAYLLNFWAFALSPFVAAVVVSYPYVKKYTHFGAYHIALIEALSVFSGAVASSGLQYTSLQALFYSVPWLFVAATLFWAVGFDLYNHIQDMEFDKSVGVKNLTILLSSRALPFAGMNQIASVVLAFLADSIYHLGPISYVATVLHGLVMAYAYYSATRQRFGVAFNYNIIASVVLGLGMMLDIALGRPWF